MQTESSLVQILSAHQVVTHPTELVTYEVDAGLDRGAPQAVVYPQSEEDVVRLARWAADHRVALVARGAGTGLSGGAVADRGGVVVEFSRLNRLLELDARGRSAVVEPGMLNLVLDEECKRLGLYYPPDPASQRASTLGGNAAENAGGPHCFKYGVTTNYITGMRVVISEGRVVCLGGRALDYPEYDFVGLMVGSEGTLGLMTQFDVRLVRNPPGVKTMMAVFDSVEQAGVAVSAVIAAGLVPATMEMMDQKITQIIEDYAHAGLPTDAGAVLIIEADGYPASLDTQIEEVADILVKHGGRGLRIAQSAAERERIWYARKSAAGAMSRLAPAYYLVDITVPRSRLGEALAQVNQILDTYALRAGHVFHAGDGNLHPLILLTDPDDRELVHTAERAGREMAEIGVRCDGSITGEHGVGIEKREHMALMYSAAELAAMWDVKQVFDPRDLMNPGKMFPSKMPEVAPAPNDAVVAGAVFAPSSASQAAGGLAALARANRRVRIAGSGTAPVAPTETLLSTETLTGIKAYAPDDLYITVGAGMRLKDVQEFLARDRKHVTLASPWENATVGGIVAANANAPLRTRYGSIRDLVLALTVALPDGRVIRAGRPVVKNVAGYDLPKVFIGSHGTLGLIADVTLKLNPLPRARRTLIAPVADLKTALDWAAQVAPGALVASAILIVKATSDVGSWTSDMPTSNLYLVYTAEGIREDVDTELANVRAAFGKYGSADAREVESPTGTQIWASVLASSTDAVQVRVGIAPKHLANYAQASVTNALDAGSFVIDAPSGMIYLAAQPGDLRGWLKALREPARALGGYAVVTAARSDVQVDRWGYEPESLDLMRGLKARWDPAGILNPGEFVL